MRHLISSYLVTFLLIGPTVEAAWIVKGVRTRDGFQPLAVTEIAKPAPLLPRKLNSFPRFIEESGKSKTEVYEEIILAEKDLPVAYSSLMQSQAEGDLAAAEVRTIVEQGPKENRICLTFTGDGYTANEKDKFFKDVALLVDDLFNGKTFASYRPLFNVYAVFVPSRESGITDLSRKDTAFGLYRSPAGSKRAIIPGNTGAIDRAIRLAPKTDYPIVIANDEFYGGLGGQYAVTSSSRQSGKIVLRHELGHNFGRVGEEYDGGSVYTGANNSSSSQGAWQQWLATPQAKVGDSRNLAGTYVWQNLRNGPVVQQFNFPQPSAQGNFWFEVQLSSVGWERLDDVEVLLDGVKLEIEGIGTADRSFFNTKRVRDLPAGPHTLEVREVNPDGDNVLAFARLYAYAPDYDFGPSIGAYKTYDENQNLTYRPTHKSCIMRDMLAENFCSVDQENMWFEFLKRTRLIDQVVKDSNSVSVKHIANLPLIISWFKKNGENWEIQSWANGIETLDAQRLQAGQYKVRVELNHREIKLKDNSLVDEMEFQIN